MPDLSDTKVRFILNPRAGSGKYLEKLIQWIHLTFSETGIKYDIQITQKRRDGMKLAQEAIREGYLRIVAAGGDGTINEVGNALVHTEAILGIIPIGSGNGLARALKIPLDWKKACQLLFNGRIHKIDIGKLSSGFHTRYFFATAGVGFEAYLGCLYDKNATSRRGIWPYFFLALREFHKFQPPEMMLEFTTPIGQKKIIGNPFIVTIANTEQFGGGAIIAPGALPDDGVLNLCIIYKLSFLQALYHAPKLFTGNITRVPQMMMYPITSLNITRKSSTPVQVDGEPVMCGPEVSVTVLPGALKVFTC
ncbi:MAG TPA: diacylglycerol kinase family protein [Candidatus Limnocylindrales bacterium]|nr:diacylglycerol kinase family protein [Candidatus Limnocylindrales bacterium]